MGKPDHAPTFGTANRVWRLGKINDRECPECRGELEPAGDSTVVCIDCTATYPVGRGVR